MAVYLDAGPAGPRHWYDLAAFAAPGAASRHGREAHPRPSGHLHRMSGVPRGLPRILRDSIDVCGGAADRRGCRWQPRSAVTLAPALSAARNERAPASFDAAAIRATGHGTCIVSVGTFARANFPACVRPRNLGHARDFRGVTGRRSQRDQDDRKLPHAAAHRLLLPATADRCAPGSVPNESPSRVGLPGRRCSLGLEATTGLEVGPDQTFRAWSFGGICCCCCSG